MHATSLDRRSGTDRRQLSLSAFWYGARRPRRLGGRREADRYYPIVDWHSPRVFAWVMSILMLCVADGVLTVLLMSHGATEVNPLLAMLLPHSLGLFAAVKLSFTAVGIVILVICSKMKLFRTVPGEVLLAITCGGYFSLIIYEIGLLERIPA